MSKRLDVATAVKALVEGTLDEMEVLGLDDDAVAPLRLPVNGRAIVRGGDLGEPEIDLSPLAYNWMHRILIELAKPGTTSTAAEAALDDATDRLSAAVTADRTLGGLCEWIELAAPETESAFVEGAKPTRTTELILTAHYQTSSPTG